MAANDNGGLMLGLTQSITSPDPFNTHEQFMLSTCFELAPPLCFLVKLSDKPDDDVDIRFAVVESETLNGWRSEWGFPFITSPYDASWSTSSLDSAEQWYQEEVQGLEYGPIYASVEKTENSLTVKAETTEYDLER